MAWILGIDQITFRYASKFPRVAGIAGACDHAHRETAMDRLALAQAQRIIAAALEHSAASGYKPMAVVVLDESGCLKAACRQDGATMFRVDIASAKAWAAVSMGASSRALMLRAKENPTFLGSLAAVAQGKFVAQTGAVLIKNAAGEIVGAAGASGGTGDEDEAICIAGIAAAGLVHG
jgi:uncharacterized protein GlcG (DUF336 family)